jgi:hypothetical protein
VAFQTSPPEALFCTPNGSLQYSHKGATIFSIIASKAGALPARRPVLNTDADLAAHRRQVRDRLSSLLRYEKHEEPLRVRKIMTTPREGYRVDIIQFLSEPGIYIPVWVFVPQQMSKPLHTILNSMTKACKATGWSTRVGKALG